MRILSLLMTVSLLLSVLNSRAVPGLNSRAPVGPFLNNTLPQSLPQISDGWTTVKAFPNLTFEDPVLLTHEPGTQRLYVAGRQGMIWYFTNQPNASNKTAFLDIRSRTQGWDDCGLLGFAFHPEYGQAQSTNRGYIYVWYQYSTNIQGSATERPDGYTAGYNRLSRFTVPQGSLVADPASELVLINIYDRHLWHNGGSIFFGPDGFLYLANGDEGGAEDEFDQSQRINRSLFGGVFRIDVNQNPATSHPIRRQPIDVATPPVGWPPSFTTNYFIPNDNPAWTLNGVVQTNVLDEFWAVGLRSPHRMTYDPITDEIWLGDVGQGNREEVSIIQEGGNLQWPYREGIAVGFKPKPSPLLGIDTPPIYDYGHDDGNGCVIGGYIYRGPEHFGILTGKYIFGDNNTGRIWALTRELGNPVVVSFLCNMPPGMNYAGGLSSFGLDANNELYMCAMGPAGQIYKLSRDTASLPQPPALLSQTGVFTNLATLATAPAFIPYNVNAPLWSDAAAKFRWIAVPNNGAPYTSSERVSFSPQGEWSFPQGTVFVKHFELSVNETNPAVTKRLETRLIVSDTNGSVYGITYKWRADNSDADLLNDALNEDVLITGASGTRTQTWAYPSRQDCLRCHTPASGFVLGVKTRQINGDYTYTQTGITDNQLNTWNHLGMLNPSINEADIPTFDRLVHMTNLTASVESRVRSYLDSNCAHCHRPGGVHALFDARYDVPLASQGIINGVVHNPLGISGARVVSPQSVSQSIAHLRMNSPAANKMPPLARNVVDSQAVSVLAQWINSLSPRSPLPAPWLHQDIGGPALPGDAYLDNGAIEILASGFDIWDVADSFHFAYQSLNGNGEIIARVSSIQDTFPWAKAGLMIRQSLDESSAHSFIAITPGNGVTYQIRPTFGSSSLDTTQPDISAPIWLRMVRAGSLFSGYYSLNGQNWTLLDAVSVNMTSNVFIGLAVTSHDDTVLNNSRFDNVAINIRPSIISHPQSQSVAEGANATFSVAASGASPLFYQWIFNAQTLPGATGPSYTRTNVLPSHAGQYSVIISNSFGLVQSSNATLTLASAPLPIPWLHQNIGDFTIPGNAYFTNNSLLLVASGSDIWATYDGFGFVYQPLNGNGEIVARVASIQNTYPWAKAGVMIRETLTDNSRNAFMGITPEFGPTFQLRQQTGLPTLSTNQAGLFAPIWLRLVRTNNLFSGYYSTDGAQWILSGSGTATLNTNTYIGLALTSHDNSELNSSVFDNIVISGVAPTLTSSFYTNNILTMNLSGQLGERYELQSSTNLSNWQVIRTLTNTTGQIQFSETNSPFSTMRFYRLRVLQ